MVIIFLLLGPFCVFPLHAEEIKSDTTIAVLFSGVPADKNYYTFAYPSTSSIEMESDTKTGLHSMRMTLDPQAYSGCAVGTARTIDARPLRFQSDLVFWIKGEYGEEDCEVCLVDSDYSDGTKCEVRLPIRSFIDKKITSSWQKVVIPLSKFPETGAYWDGTRMIQHAFDWSDIAEFRLTSRPGLNVRECVLYVRSVSLCRSKTSYVDPKRHSVPDAQVVRADGEGGAEGCYTGVFVNGVPETLSAVDTFERLAGKKSALVFWYSDWSKPFPAQECGKVWERGSVPYIFWEAWVKEDKDAVCLSSILAGDWDTYLYEWALSAKEYGKPLFLIWGHECNGTWYPWSIALNGKNADCYIRAYRYIHDIFSIAGAGNVRWVWSVNHESVPLEPWNECTRAYPGDGYVDWIGMVGYNKGTTASWSRWLSFEGIFSRQYKRLTSCYPDKPIMITEYGCSEKGGSKSQWITCMHKTLREKFPRIRCINLFNIMKEADFRVESSLSSLQAYQKMFQDPYFLTSAQALSATAAKPDTAGQSALREQAMPKTIVDTLAQLQSSPDPVDADSLMRIVYTWHKDTAAFSAYRNAAEKLNLPSALIGYYILMSYADELNWYIQDGCWDDFERIKQQALAAARTITEAAGTGQTDPLLTARLLYAQWYIHATVFADPQKQLDTLAAAAMELPQDSHTAAVLEDIINSMAAYGKIDPFRRMYRIYLACCINTCGFQEAVDKSLAFSEENLFEERPAIAQAVDTECAQVVMCSCPMDKAASFLQEMGDTYTDISNDRAAMEFYRMLIDKYPQRVNPAYAYIQLAACYERKKDYGLAIDTLRDYILLFPADTDRDRVSYKLGLTEYLGGMAKKSLETFAELIILHPSSPWAGEARYMTGLIHYQSGRYAQAKHAFEAALTTYPDSEYAAAAKRCLTAINTSGQDPGLAALRHNPSQEKIPA